MTVRNRSLRGSARRGFAVAAMSALVLASLPLSGTAFGAQENTEYLTGADTVAASIEWSQFTFDSAAAVAVGRDDVFADSLASGLIQGLGDGVPLLLTDSDTLDARVSAEIERLGATTVHILGGQTAIGSGVEDALEADGLTIHRHAGATRVETAIDIASKHGAAATTAIVARAFASGADPTQAFADSLAAGGWAAEDDLPILLTQTNELHEAVEGYLAASDVKAVNVVGGTSAVSDAVVSSIEALGIDVTRVSGPTRFDTAIEIAKARGFDSAADAVDGVVVIEGQAADAWAAGFAAAAYAAGAGPGMGVQVIGVDGRPIILVNGNDVPAATQAFLADGGGINVVCFSNATACDAASAAAGNGVLLDGNATFTDAPELVSVEVTGEDDDEDELLVLFTFDEAVVDGAVSGGNFSLVKYDGTTATTGGDSDVDGNQVEVIFGLEAGEYATTAVVDNGAVQDEDGNENIEGSAPLQDVGLTNDRTEGPDVTDVELDGDNNEAVWIFDENVETRVTITNSMFQLILVDEDTDDATPILNTTTVATAVTIDENEVTVKYADSDTSGLTEDNEDNIARAVLAADVVEGYNESQSANSTDDTNRTNNDVQSIDLDGDPEDSPRLLSATVDLADDADEDDDEEDTVVYRFSEAVDVTLNHTRFHVLLADGTPLTGNAIDTEDSEGTRVEVEFADDTLDETIVRAYIDDNAVDEDGASLTGNIEAMSVGVAPESFDAGETSGPDVESISVDEDLNSFNELTGYEVTIDFDDTVDAVDEGAIVAYDIDGDEETSVFDDCEIDDDDNSIVTCTIDDEDDAEDVVAFAIQDGFAEDPENHGSYAVAFGFEVSEA